MKIFNNIYCFIQKWSCRVAEILIYSIFKILIWNPWLNCIHIPWICISAMLFLNSTLKRRTSMRKRSRFWLTSWKRLAYSMMINIFKCRIHPFCWHTPHALHHILYFVLLATKLLIDIDFCLVTSGWDPSWVCWEICGQAGEDNRWPGRYKN